MEREYTNRHASRVAEGTGLTEKDYFQIGGLGGDLKIAIDAVREVSRQEGWTHERAKRVIKGLGPIVRLNTFAHDESLENLIQFARLMVISDQKSDEPGILLGGALLDTYGEVDDGQLVRVLAYPWERILESEYAA